MVNPKDGVQELLTFICSIVIAMVETYFYTLAVFTYEPVLMCWQCTGCLGPRVVTIFCTALLGTGCVGCKELR